MPAIALLYLYLYRWGRGRRGYLYLYLCRRLYLCVYLSLLLYGFYVLHNVRWLGLAPGICICISVPLPVPIDYRRLQLLVVGIEQITNWLLWWWCWCCYWYSGYIYIRWTWWCIYSGAAVWCIAVGVLGWPLGCEAQPIKAETHPGGFPDQQPPRKTQSARRWEPYKKKK